MVGRPDPIKRLDLALRAAAHLVYDQGLRDISLVLVGGEPENPRMRGLQALARQLGLEERVHFRGVCPRDKMPLYYSAADVCLITSRYESFSLAAAEALACGTPVVATRAGGLKVLVRHGQTGLLVTGQRPEAFSRALRTILDGRLAGGARDSVLPLSWSRVGQRVLDLYRGELLRARALAGTWAG